MQAKRTATLINSLFRNTATQLANRIAEHFQVPVSSLFDWHDFVPKQRGELSGGWDFFFHGYECAFGNHLSGQAVEIRLEFGEEFGVLDPYFFAQFMKSTAEFRYLSSILPDFESNARAFDILERHQLLRRVPSVYSDTSGLVAHK